MRGLRGFGCLLAFACTGCFHIGEPLTADESQEATLKCSGGWAECYRQANRLCADGFDELHRTELGPPRSTLGDDASDLDSIQNETFVHRTDERLVTVRCR